jgi:hypothetical protein
MDMDTSIGMVSDELPEMLNVLVERTGFADAAVALWNAALDQGSWPSQDSLAIWAGTEEVGAPDDVHVLAVRLARGASEEDSGGLTTYAYVHGTQGDLLSCADVQYVFRDGRWWIAPCEVIDTDSAKLSSWIGQIRGVVIGLTGEIETISGWELPIDSEHQSFDDFLDEYGDEILGPEDVYVLAHSKLPEGILIVNAWGIPTFGPPSPDPSSGYHRLRIAAMRLARQGVAVTVDWGPFTQDYDSAPSTREDESSVFIDATSAEFTTSSAGLLRAAVVGGDESESTGLVMQVGTSMGLVDLGLERLENL